MNAYLKEFILNNKNLINENTEESWSQLYSLLIANRTSAADAFYVGSFTKILLETKINPLNSLSFVPTCFLYEVFETEVPQNLIPNHITKIEEEAFSGCTFGTLHLPKNLKQINAWAFEVCSIKDLYFDNDVEIIDEKAFADADIQHVYFTDLNTSFDWIVGVESITHIECLNNTIDEISDKIKYYNKKYGEKWDFWQKVTKVKCKDGSVKRG